MSTRRQHPARWISSRRARRAGQRRRLAWLHRGIDPANWARLLALADKAQAGPSCAANLPRGNSAHGKRAPRQAPPTFVEFSPVLPQGPVPCTFELCDPSGRKLTLCVPCVPGPELAALTQALWGRLR